MRYSGLVNINKFSIVVTQHTPDKWGETSSLGNEKDICGRHFIFIAPLTKEAKTSFKNKIMNVRHRVLINLNSTNSDCPLMIITSNYSVHIALSIFSKKRLIIMGILRHLRKIEVVSFTLEMYGIPRNGERVQISNLKKK